MLIPLLFTGGVSLAQTPQYRFGLDLCHLMRFNNPMSLFAFSPNFGNGAFVERIENRRAIRVSFRAIDFEQKMKPISLCRLDFFPIERRVEGFDFSIGGARYFSKRKVLFTTFQFNYHHLTYSNRRQSWQRPQESNGQNQIVDGFGINAGLGVQIPFGQRLNLMVATSAIASFSQTKDWLLFPNNLRSLVFRTSPITASLVLSLN